MSNQIIPAELVEWVDALLNGARIEKISSDAELKNSVELLKNAKRTAADLEAKRKELVGPLNDRVKEINAAFKEKSEPLDALCRNVQNVGAVYQMEQQRKAEEAARKAEEEAQAERRRLAEIEQKRIADEEALREEALKAQAILNDTAAEEQLTTEERAELIDKANTAAELADIAQAEAINAAIAQSEVVAAPVEQKVFQPAGFKAKMKYSARIIDQREFLRYIVTEKEWGYIEGAALTKILESAGDKMAKNMEERFKIPGCSLVAVPDATLRRY